MGCVCICACVVLMFKNTHSVDSFLSKCLLLIERLPLHQPTFYLNKYWFSSNKHACWFSIFRQKCFTHTHIHIVYSCMNTFVEHGLNNHQKPLCEVNYLIRVTEIESCDATFSSKIKAWLYLWGVTQTKDSLCWLWSVMMLIWEYISIQEWVKVF